MDAHYHVRRRLEGDGPSNTTYIIVGAAVGFVALLVVVGGVLLCRNERRKAKALTEIEQYVNVAPMPPASQLSPGISATKAPVLALNSTSMELPVGATSPSGFYVMTSPQNGARFGSYQSQSQGQSIGQSAGSHPLADAPFAVAASDDTLSLRSRSNSFEKHESYRRLVLGDNGSSASTTNESASNGESPLWTDPAILAGRIPLEQVEIGALISRGGFGEVLRGLYRNETVAIKRLLPETRRDLRHIEQFLSEIKLMATLEHPRIVRFVGVAWAAPSDLCVATEFMGGGDVRLLLTQFDEVEHRPQGFDTVKATIAHDVAYGLTYLHSFDPVVLHRDLKSKNVLLDGDRHAKLTDFGVSRERSDATMTAGVGTLLWMAPEVMMGDRYDDKADMFSFGVVLSELDTQRLPYEHAKTTETGRTIPDAAILQLVAADELRVRFTQAASPARAAIARLGEACVDIDPAKRPSAAQALYQLQLALRAFDQERVALATIDSVSSFVF